MQRVKGHAKQIDIDRGRTTEEDKKGNDGADALAVAGAQLHPVPTEVLEAAKNRKQWAICVQQMMLAVLKARLHAERGRSNDAGNADRGSDMDECMEFDLLDLHDTELAAAFDDVVAQVDVPEDARDVEGRPDNMHEHVVQMNSLDDEFDVGSV